MNKMKFRPLFVDIHRCPNTKWFLNSIHDRKCEHVLYLERRKAKNKYGGQPSSTTL